MMDAEKALGIAAGVDPELAERLRFILEIDKLKSVLRQTMLADDSRRENSAEHSWHLAMTAMALAPFADEPVDLERVVKILLVHDIVEIDAGDVFIYDAEARAAVAQAELEAADRIFGMLPDPPGSDLRSAWDEYEARETPEAKFAYSCDRLQPLMLNLSIGGGSWNRHGITADQVKKINGGIALGMTKVWQAAEAMLDAAVADGALAPPPAAG